MVTTNKTAETIANTDLGVFDDLFRAYMQKNSWYRKYANTIKTGILGLLTLIGVVTSVGIDLPVPVAIGIAVVGLAAQLFGVDDPEKTVAKAVTATGKHRA